MTKTKKETLPSVGVLMGSRTDLETMNECAKLLEELGIPYEMKVLSAHRAPEALVEYAKGAAGRGLKVLVGGAGGAAALPGMLASLTTLPVIGVPIESRALKGLDSLLSIAQMPSGVPVATVAIGGAKNAAWLAARILALQDAGLAGKLKALRDKAAQAVPEDVQ
ncbi:MAG TPA: 5-(carboxyamino)imidazole ribonucleotide mutase [Elusimicrobia bacterium]|nr:5-(carboxyamino)imidazole ribonucleotide mutase [Elusimicrobiota bacterium]